MVEATATTLPSKADADWGRCEKAFLKGAGIAAVAGTISVLNGNWILAGICAATVVTWLAGAALCGRAAR